MSTVIDLARRSKAGASLASADNFIAAAHAQPGGPVVIAGSAHLELLLALTRRSFARVSCQSPDHGPHIPNSKADAIFAPALRDETQLSSVIKGMASGLNPSGMLVLEAPPLEPSAELRLRTALRAQGFNTVAPVGARSGSTLWCAEKQPAAMVSAA